MSSWTIYFTLLKSEALQLRWRQFCICNPTMLHVMMTSSNGNIFPVAGHLCSSVTGEFPAQRPVTRSFDVFVDLHLNKRLSKQSWDWWFETPVRPLRRHCNGCKPLASSQAMLTTLVFWKCNEANLANLKGFRWKKTKSFPILRCPSGEKVINYLKSMTVFGTCMGCI